MSDIDELSHRLGRIEQKLDHLTEREKYASDHRHNMANAIQPLMALPERVKQLEKTVGLHERWRWYGMGVVGTIGGFLGSFFEKFRG